MKKILFVLLFCFLNTVFSQERESKIISDLKIGTYQNKISSTESKDKKKKSATLDIFVSEPRSNGLFNLCIDVFVNKRSEDNYDGMGISIGSDKLDMVFNNLVSAQKQFQSLLNRGEVPEGMKIPIGRQFPVHVYKWTSEQPNGPANRADNNNDK